MLGNWGPPSRDPDHPGRRSKGNSQGHEAGLTYRRHFTLQFRSFHHPLLVRCNWSAQQCHRFQGQAEVSKPLHDTILSTLIFFASLFTLKDGLVFIEAFTGDDVAAQADASNDYVFADLNGDDWFYFEDSTTSSLLSSSSRERCAKSTAQPTFTARTISGSDTTLLSFEYTGTPSHKVLHEGRCNFAGLTPVSSSSQSDPDSGNFRFRSQEL